MSDKLDFGLLPRAVMTTKLLSFGAKVLYAALKYHGRNENKDCFPTNQTLADGLGTSTRNIQNLLKELVENQFIRYEYRSGANKNIRYIVLLKG